MHCLKITLPLNFTNVRMGCKILKRLSVEFQISLVFSVVYQ